MTPWLIVPALVIVVTGGAIWAAWFMQHDTGQRAAARGTGGRHSPVAAEPRARTVRREPTASEPPAAITETPCAEPPAGTDWTLPPAEPGWHQAETQASMPAITS
jgi:hypothetical protein